MSIERRQRKKGVVYVVWWREGARNRNRTFDRKKDAEAFEAQIKLSKRRGDLADLDAGKQRFADFADEWWSRYAEPNLERKTLAAYESVLKRHILPRLGGFELRQLHPDLIESFASDLHNAGVGEETIRKALVLLHGTLKRAVVWRRIQLNPVSSVKKPNRARKRVVRPIHPKTVEALRTRVASSGRPRDAALISVLAYAGLRPGEALALRWGDVGDTTLLVDKALALGEVKDTKTRRSRTVRLLKPLVSDLAEWRLASGRPAETELIFRWNPDARGRTRPTETGAGACSGQQLKMPASAIFARTTCATASHLCSSRRGSTPPRSRSRWATPSRRC
jgi:integrase